MTPAEQRAWLSQWKSARVALERVETLELRSLTAASALAASDALLSLARPEDVEPERIASSGLVEQQRLFLKLRRT
jgi:hypothetical protein